MKSASVHTFIPDLSEARKALDSLEKHLGHALPHDLEALAEELGLEINYTDELPEKTGGFITSISDDGAILAINSNKSKIYQIYSIAHEIGHYYLYHDEDNAGSTPEKERKADAFAFLLLTQSIPSDQLRPFMQENPELFEFSYMSGMVAIGFIFSKVPLLGVLFMGIYAFFKFQELMPDTPALPPAQEDKP